VKASERSRLTGGHALWPEAREWLHPSTVVVLTEAPVSIMLDVFEPLPAFFGVAVQALHELDTEITGVGSIHVDAVQSR
jgi:hypothetical protein